VVEVMMALAVLGIGGAGIISMQRTTILGNTRGRNLTTANAIAATWAERLRADAASWTVQRSATGDVHSFNDAGWLTNVGDTYETIEASPGGSPPREEDEWIKPVAQGTMQPTAGVLGQDVDEATDPNAVGFCTHLRLTHILPRVIRAEVRVLWLRHGGGGMWNTTGGLCDVDPADAGDHPERYHLIYLTTAILQQD
jgi:hypothetical protein